MFFKKYYSYYIFYNFTGGYGSMELIRNAPIKTMDDIKAITSYIENEHDYKNVILVNWIKTKPRKDAKTFLNVNGK
jgi:hypothetical protein